MTVKGMIIKIKTVINVNVSEGNVHSLDHGTQYLDVSQEHYDHLFEGKASRNLKEEFSRALGCGKERERRRFTYKKWRQ